MCPLGSGSHETPPCEIRPAGAADVAAMARLEAAAFTPPWSVRMLDEELRSADRLVRVAVADGAVTGYAIFRRLAGEAELLRIAVDPRHRRRGIAAALLGSGLAELAGAGTTACHLEVRSDDAGACAFYAACGFVAVGTRRGYYSAEVDATLYRLSPIPAPPLGLRPAQW